MELKNITKENLKDFIPILLSFEDQWAKLGGPLWSAENFEKDLPGKWDMSKYAVVDGKVVGYIIVSCKGNTAKGHRIIVDTKYQGRGVSGLLVRDLFEECKKRNLTSLEFKVLKKNYAALAFYKRYGCVITGEVEGEDKLWRYLMRYTF